MRSFIRFISISRILIRYRLDNLVLSTALLKSFRPLIYLTPWHYFPSSKFSRGERIRLALEELGPIFIKFGQTLSTRRDLLPDDIGDELAKLQDKCPPFPAKDSKLIIEKSLGESADSLFSSFADEPLASASIAQVHSAITLGGEEIIIKVVRPGIKKQIKRDVRLLYAFARLAEKHPDGKRLRPQEAVAEFERIIYKELNMMTEAANASLLRKNFSDSNLLYVPKVHWDLCRSNILVTERIYGTPISNVDALKKNKTDLKMLAENGVVIFFTQVFEHNFFHADMHPGNIFVSDTGQYIGVDFGIMGVLSEDDKDFLADIFLAFFNQDYQKVAQVYIDSGWVGLHTDEKAFEAAVKKICDPMFDKPLGDISFGQVLLDLIQEAKNFDIKVQPQLLLLDKTLLNIEGLGRQLYPQLDLWSTAKPFLEDLMKERYSVKNTFEKLKEEAPQLLKDIPELPALTINALKQLGKMKDINKLYSQQTEQIVTQLSNNANRQTAAIFSGSLLILSGVFAVNNAWFSSGISALAAVLFWIKSR